MQGQGISLRGHIRRQNATLFECHHWADRPDTVAAHGWIKAANLHVNAEGRFVGVTAAPVAPDVVRGALPAGPLSNGGFVVFTPVVKVMVR